MGEMKPETLVLNNLPFSQFSQIKLKFLILSFEAQHEFKASDHKHL